MKIYINKPRNHWLSPYTILEKILFWLDWDNISYDATWVKKWSGRINPFSIGLQKILDFIHPQITYVKIDGFDAWNADHTLALIILPVLKKIKESKAGIPGTWKEDAPQEFWDDEEDINNDENSEYSFNEKRWEWILNEMIFAFNCMVDDSWEQKFHSGKIDFNFVATEERDEKGKPLYYEIVDGPKHTHKFDSDGYNEVQKRIWNGLRLFGKYYQSLWT